MSKRLALECDHATVELLPESGGRIVSMRRHKPAFECFPSPETGIVDVFPCRGAGKYPTAPYEKIEIAALGDVRSRVWQWERRDRSIRLWLADKRFGYKLEKRLTWLEGSTLRIDYRLDNVADEGLMFQWSARAVLPAGPSTAWRLPAGKWRRISGTGDASPTDFGSAEPGRWAMPGPTGENRCEWTDRTAGVKLSLRGPGGALPALFAEVLPGGLLALEPATSIAESPADLRRATPGWVGPLSTCEWWLEIALG